MQETACCFFGHHYIKDEISVELRHEIRNLIENENVRKFYVGNHGDFDQMVTKILREMKKEFPHINYAVVLAYMPNRPVNEYPSDFSEETLFPDGLEKVPRKHAILWRNDWMLKRSDIVLCYVWHFLGGSGRMIEKAIKQKKRIINLAKMQFTA